MSGWWARARAFLLGDQERAPEPPFPSKAFDDQGWLQPNYCTVSVNVIPSRAGWYYRKLDTKSGWPTGIVAHYTATDPGTAIPMAERRRDHERKEFADEHGHMPGSWHFTVAQSGLVIQQLSIRQGAFHAGSPTARRTPVGWANHTCVGIELEGHGDSFTDLQVKASCWLWSAIVERSGIERAHAMIGHSWIDPTRRHDPGPVWTERHAARVLEAAFAP